MNSFSNNNDRSERSFIAALVILAASLLLVSLSSCKSQKSLSNNTKYDTESSSVYTSNKVKDKVKGKLLEEAYTWIGTPYKYAAAEKGVGADCSGFVMKVFYDAINYSLPRNSAKQAEFCSTVNNDKVQPGDLVFFATGKSAGQVSHVGIMVDTLQFIHASSSKGVVISDLSKPYYRRTFVKFGRVPPR